MQEFGQNWQKLSEEVLIGRKEWREQHPKATLTKIEAAAHTIREVFRQNYASPSKRLTTPVNWVRIYFSTIIVEDD